MWFDIIIRSIPQLLLLSGRGENCNK